MARTPVGPLVGAEKPVDFVRGPAEMAEAIRARRPARLTAAFGVHIVELVERLQYPERFAGRSTVETTFEPIAPQSWAQ